MESKDRDLPIDAARTMMLTKATLCAIAFLLLAFTALRTWEELLVVGTAVAYPPLPFSIHQAFFGFKAIGFLALALAAPRIGALSSKPVAYGAGGVLLVAASAVLSNAAVLPSAGPMVFAGCAVGGLGVAVAVLLWFESTAFLHPLYVVLCYVGAHLLSPFVSVFCLALPAGATVVLAIVLAVSAFGCTGLAFAYIPQDEDARLEAGAFPRSLYRIVALVCVLTFAFTFREPTLGNDTFDSGSHTSIGSIVVSAVVLMSVLVQDRYFNLVTLARVVLPVTVIAFLLLPLDLPLLGTVSNIASAATVNIVKAIAVVAIAHYVYRHRRLPAQMFGIAEGIVGLFVVVGWGTWEAFDSLLGDPAAIMAAFNVIAAVVVALTILLLPGKRALRDWGLETDGSREAQAQSVELAHRQHEFALAYGLTPREETVLDLLLQRRSNAEIEESLQVSKQTVRSHKRNIYTKCDVHSVDELVALFDDFAADAAAPARSES